jgi:hypothetical protein
VLQGIFLNAFPKNPLIVEYSEALKSFLVTNIKNPPQLEKTLRNNPLIVEYSETNQRQEASIKEFFVTNINHACNQKRSKVNHNKWLQSLVDNGIFYNQLLTEKMLKGQPNSLTL